MLNSVRRRIIELLEDFRHLTHDTQTMEIVRVDHAVRFVISPGVSAAVSHPDRQETVGPEGQNDVFPFQEEGRNVERNVEREAKTHWQLVLVQYKLAEGDTNLSDSSLAMNSIKPTDWPIRRDMSYTFRRHLKTSTAFPLS